MSIRPSALQGEGTKLNTIDAGLKDLQRQPTPRMPAQQFTTASSSVANPVVVFTLPGAGVRILNVMGSGFTGFKISGGSVIVYKTPILFRGTHGNKYYGYCKEEARLHDALGLEVYAKQIDSKGFYSLSVPMTGHDGDVILFEKDITVTIMWEYI